MFNSNIVYKYKQLISLVYLPNNSTFQVSINNHLHKNVDINNSVDL